jgi:hypothetical protein
MPDFYKDADLSKFATAIAEAQAMIDADALQVRAAHGDSGTCVIGAGIAVNYRGPRRRVTSDKVVASASRFFQGNSSQHRACERALAHLQAAGLDVFWNDGRMD